MTMQEKPAVIRPRLGRGLSSLISSSITSTQYEPVKPVAEPAIGTTNAGAVDIAVDNIAPNPFQPRREFEPRQLQELADSITQQGVLQPLIVAPAGEVQSDRPYVLIAGERRLRAAKQVGLANVPCVVRTASRQQMLEWALVENIQRADLNPMERARAYQDYIERFALTQEQAAQKLGQPRTTVANYLRILDLQPEVQGLVLQDRLSFGHAKVLAGLVGQDARQLALAQRVVGEGLSVRQLEELMEKPAQGDLSAVATSVRATRTKAPYLRDLEEQLTEAVGTRVAILPSRAKNTGRVVISFYNLEDFDRIAAMLGLKINS